jgi:hypothetical protein
MASAPGRSWIYLHEPLGGGETEFPDLGFKIEPKLGRAVLWNNLYASGEGNYSTQHQSLPVTAGTKTIITKWFRVPKVPKPRQARDSPAGSFRSRPP